jgi:hypothetical protein
MRYYQSVWYKLKALPLYDASTKGVSITANRLSHRRIIKAVQKEKWLDIPYKMQNDSVKIIMCHERKGSVITFYLKPMETTIDSRSI